MPEACNRNEALLDELLRLQRYMMSLYDSATDLGAIANESLQDTKREILYLMKT